MATRDFEVQQLLKAYRKGLISDDVFEVQMQDVAVSNDGLDVANVLTHRGDGSKVTSRTLHKTTQSETAVPNPRIRRPKTRFRPVTTGLSAMLAFHPLSERGDYRKSA